MLHIPILRKGLPYRSVDVKRTAHYRDGQPFVEISQANAGLIRRDLLEQEGPRKILASIPAAELIEICRQAAACFTGDTLPIGDQPQSPDDYIRQVSTTTGLPHALARRNMEKIGSALLQMEAVLRGLTRGLDVRALDDGYTSGTGGQPLSYFPRTQSLGVVLPSNSPGVHSLWAPAIALKMPLVLKPGAAEPWTPYRIAQAMIRAGCPREAFSYYPSDHAGSSEILRSCGRSMLFGDVAVAKAWKGEGRVEVHGPGYSKIIIGEDLIDQWPRYLNVIAASVADNSGRSCVNASGIWVPRHGAEIAKALAERLASIRPLAAEDPEARLAPFVDPNVARRISAMIDMGLAEPGATDLSASFREPDRLSQWDSATYLLPTVVQCDSPEHPLANREFLFPFASVVELPQDRLLSSIGPSLVVTAITNDPVLKRDLLASSSVGRLNFGPIATNHIAWDQPHEGNLFDHLYARRAFQFEAAAS
jgi:acyl-CoA reductase-like NAD-dependent aldehyde dehydrogenase